MKLGISEILVIGIVIAIVGATHLRSQRLRQPVEAGQKQLTSVEARDLAIVRARRSKGKTIGIMLIIIGVVLIATAPNLIKAFFMSYLGGALVIVIGLSLFYFMSRRP